MKHNNFWKRTAAGVMALLVAAGNLSANTDILIHASAAVNEKVVSAFSKVYDGDTDKAREKLEALYQAGIIDENGNMVELDICENGKEISLEEVMAKIAAGEKVGDLTINGHATTEEQLAKIQAVKNALEIAKMMSDDVEITDEHVENLESLIKGIGDGSIDIGTAIQNGSISVNSSKSASPTATLVTRNTYAPETSELPSTAHETGDIEATDGKYTQPYISDDTYDASHGFTLTDPQNLGYYTDRNYEGIVTDGVVTLTCDRETVGLNQTVKVTASLNKPQKVPVSFDWSATGDALAETKSGTVTWRAGESGNKTFNVYVSRAEADYWKGSRAFVINAGNLKGALFSEDKTVWNKKYTVAATDSQVIDGYVWSAYETLSGFTKYTREIKDGPGGWYDMYYYECYRKPITVKSPKIRVTASYSTDFSGGETSADLFLSDSSDAYSKGTRLLSLNTGNRKVTKTDQVIELNSTPKDTEQYLIFSFYKGMERYYSNGASFGMGKKSNGSATINSVKYQQLVPPVVTKYNSIYVPAGTYYSGEVVPVTIELSDYVVMKANNKLKVNGVECPLLDGADTESKKFTFGYTVKETDTGAINVTELIGDLYNSENKKVSKDGQFPSKSKFDKNDDVILVSAVKRASLDLENVKYGISDDDPTQQIVTALIPFKSGASVEWVGSESGDCTTNGLGIDMKLPGYGNVTVRDYLNGAYYSYDNGKTRYPVYVVRQGGDEKPVALACRFAPPVNASAYLRKDGLNLYMDTDVGISDSTKYLDTWENAQTDEMGFAYFDGSQKTNAAPVFIGQDFSFYTKDSMLFEEDKYTSRGEADYTEKTENGWLNLDDGYHVLLNDPEHPENRYDAEIVVNNAFYTAINKSIRGEDSAEDMTLTAQFSGRKNFTFTAPKYYDWVSTDETVATVIKDENGVGHVQLTGKAGKVSFKLHVLNGTPNKAYYVGSVDLDVLEGKTPFLNISKYSQVRQALTRTDVDVLFASNVTARNKQIGEDTSVFTAKLYKAKESDSGYEKTNELIWTGSFDSTVENTLTHITVPGAYINQAGAYALEIETEFVGGNVGDYKLPKASLSATAYIAAEQAPTSVELDKLNSYYVTADNIPVIGYTVSDPSAEVEYTIQKSGEKVSKRMPARGGVIRFAPGVPSSLKEAYTITVYARSSEDDDWSLDSMLLTVYNPGILDQIVTDVASGEIGGTTGGMGTAVNGSTVIMDNHEKVQEYVGENGYKLNYGDFTALRTDMSLQKIVSVNYGEAVYGMLSDKMKWESSDPNTVSVNYKQGGIYSDIRNYSYTSYAPATDFLLVGKRDTDSGDDNEVTITATHANTGISSSFDVTAKTLKNQLYLFQFNPAVETTVTYTNGNGVKRTLESDNTGKLAVYEPDGINGSVMAMAKDGESTYVGTLFQSDLETGERDVASLQLYPCNNLRLRKISDAELTFLAPDGSPYTGEVTIRGGAYKNGVYCPDAKIRVGDEGEPRNGRQDIQADVTDGKLSLRLDPTQFKIDPNSNEEFGGAQPGDTITYVFEYSFAGGSYQPGYVTLNAYTDLYGASTPTDSVVYMRNNTVSESVPQIIRQTLQQYYDGTKANPYTRNVIDYTENIGISKRFGKSLLTTDVALCGETATPNDKGYATYTSENVPYLKLCTPYDHELTGQDFRGKSEAEQIVSLSDLEDTTLFVFPFSSVPYLRNIYTMTDEGMKQDGLTDEGEDPTTSTAVKAVFVKDNRTIKTETMPFGVSNLSHQLDLSASEGGAREIGEEVNKELSNSLDIGSIFKSVEVNEMLQKGFIFLNNLSADAGDTPINMMILPTEDPGTFRIIAFIGSNKREMKTDTNPSLDFDTDHLYDDMESFEEEMEELGKDDDGDDGDDGDAGEGSVEINFYGMVVLEARVGLLGKKWGIDFCGGTVGTNFEAKYEWNQNFFCGPVPVNISFEVKGTADLEVSFANKADARALLIDAAVGVSIEAFAGIGFDLSLVALKLGIFGNIGADVNFLYLTKGDQVGTKLDIEGQIGIKLKAKILFINYEKVFASTGFKTTQKWGKYDQIKKTWENEGYADLTGVTTHGQNYSMRLMSNGTAMITIDGGGRIDNRDYLKSAPRLMKSGMLGFRGSDDGVQTLVDNAYPYSNPAMTDDGSMYLYISDNNNANKLESVVCYAVRDDSGYKDMGRVDASEGNILADSDVVASGTGENAFAAWIKQMDSPEKEMKDKATYDDLGMMLNATEIYGSSYKEGKWTTERLTDNNVADMAPTIASSGNRAIVAWRSMSATEMPEKQGTQDITAMFNAKNTINYRIFNGTEWKDAEVAYNGSAGTVNAVNTAMLPDGTSLIVYSVRTTEDLTGSETFYTLIDKDGNVVTTGRLTNDSYTDTNAQVTAVGDQFIVGWYSEHAAGEEGNTDETVVSHDIGLARVNANGSVDSNFPESIGGTAASKIGSDFHFSAPAGCNDIGDLSIVWSQNDENANKDETKQQLKAIRFFEEDGVIGVSAPTTIVETAKNNTIDQFDTYTEQNGEVKAIFVGSDYDSPDKTRVYDTIDISDLPIEVNNSKYVTVLTTEPTTSINLASGSFEESKIEAEANFDLRDLIPGMEMPVQFTIRNTGTRKVENVTAQIGEKTSDFNGLDILPGQSAVITVGYVVPENVSNVGYTLTADENGTTSGTLELNRPDVGISGMKVVREGGKTRDIRLTLSNASNIPLTGSDKTVKLAFYKDREHTKRIGDEITIDEAAYGDIDNDIYTYTKTLNVADFLGNDKEVPEEGIRIFARAWVEKTDELYTMNNDANVTINGLLSKYKSATTIDTALIKEGDTYKINADITNNSMQEATLGSIYADVLDSDGNVIETVRMDDPDTALTLPGEENTPLTKTLEDLTKEPVSVVLRDAAKSVKLDAETNSGTTDAVSVALTPENKIAGMIPAAEREGYKFIGWFTEETGGTRVTNETVLEPNTTLYAHFEPSFILYGTSLTMDGEIGVNVYLKADILDELKESCYALVKGPNDAEPVRYDFRDWIWDNKNKAYKFTSKAYSTQMEHDVTIQVFADENKDGEAEPMNLFKINSSDAEKKYTTSVKAYLDKAKQSGSEKLKKFAKAIDAYGAYAEKFFAPEDNVEAERFVDYSDISSDDVAKYDIKCVGGAPVGFKYYGNSLVLKEATSLRIYFEYKGEQLPNIRLLDDDLSYVLNPKTTKTPNYYYVEIQNISSIDLDKTYTVSVDGYRIEISAMSYVYNALKNYAGVPGYEGLVNVCRALVKYNETAKEYFL